MSIRLMSVGARRLPIYQPMQRMHTSVLNNKPFQAKGRGIAYSIAAVAAVVGAFGVMPLRQAEAKEKYKKVEHFKFVIIGAGVSARSCLTHLSNLNPEPLPANSKYAGKVLMIGHEPRMNSLGKSEAQLNQAGVTTNDPQIRIDLGHEVISLDVDAKTAQLDNGKLVAFDKCFIATGGTYKQTCTITPEAKYSVSTFRRHKDYENILQQYKAGKISHVTVVGGGSLGCEISLALKLAAPEMKVTQLYAEPGVMHAQLPEYLRAYLTAKMRSQGIEQKNFSYLTNIERRVDDLGQLLLTLDSWDQSYLATDYVLFAPTKTSAQVDLVKDAGFEIDKQNGGVVVNSELCAFTDIYVGGDVASYPNRYLGRRRDQTYDHAVSSGKHAAFNMCGHRASYDYIPVTRVDLEGLGLKAWLVGDCDSHMETVSLWEKSKSQNQIQASSNNAQPELYTAKFNKGVTFYLQNGYIVGVLLTNSDTVEKASQIIKDNIDYSALKRQDLEVELREKYGPDLRSPIWRTTFSKHHDDPEKQQSKNIYKAKRSVAEGLQSHENDILRDKSKILYWGKV